jgi:hypothetical protein
VVGKQVPLRILYATTTGTARDFATQMQVRQRKGTQTMSKQRRGEADFGVMCVVVCQREGFAMNVSSFHFDVKLTDLADYDYVDLLEVPPTLLD